MACDLSTLESESCSSGLAKAAQNEQQYRALVLQLLCLISEGGAGGSQVLSGVGAPIADPGVSNAIYTDTNTGIQYTWYNGAWH